MSYSEEHVLRFCNFQRLTGGHSIGLERSVRVCTSYEGRTTFYALAKKHHIGEHAETVKSCSMLGRILVELDTGTHI